MTDFFFVLAQQAVVDQDARELRADRLDTAAPRRPTNRRRPTGRRSRDRCRPARAPARSSARRSRPAATCRVQPQTFVRKLRRIVLPSRRVRHFGMELQAVERQRRDASPRRCGQVLVWASGTKSSDTRVDLVAVAHPDFGLARHAGEQSRRRCRRRSCSGPGRTRGPA